MNQIIICSLNNCVALTSVMWRLNITTSFLCPKTCSHLFFICEFHHTCIPFLFKASWVYNKSMWRNGKRIQSRTEGLQVRILSWMNKHFEFFLGDIVQYVFSKKNEHNHEQTVTFLTYRAKKWYEYSSSNREP